MTARGVESATGEKPPSGNEALELSRSRRLWLVARGSRRLVARVAGLTGARLVGTLCNGVSLILLARWLGPGEFGGFSIALSILLTVAGVLGLGLPVFALRAAVLERKAATGYALFLNLVGSIAAALIGLVIAAWVTDLSTWMVSILAISVAVEKNAELRVGLGTEFGHARLVNWTLAVRGILLLAVVVVGHRVGASALPVFVIGRLAVMGCSAAILVRAVRGWPLVRSRPRDDSLEVMGNIAAENSIAALRLMDVSLVGAAAGPFGAGLFAGIQKVVMPITLLTGSLRVVLMGPVARGSVRRAGRATLTLGLIAIAGAALLGIMSVWSTELVRFLLGEEFAGASTAFRWLLIQLPTVAVNPLIVTILQDKGGASWMTWTTAVTTVLRLAGVWVGGSIAGAAGATFALCVVGWLRLGALILMSRALVPRTPTVRPTLSAADPARAR